MRGGAQAGPEAWGTAPCPLCSGSTLLSPAQQLCTGWGSADMGDVHHPPHRSLVGLAGRKCFLTSPHQAPCPRAPANAWLRFTGGTASSPCPGRGLQFVESCLTRSCSQRQLCCSVPQFPFLMGKLHPAPPRHLRKGHSSTPTSQGSLASPKSQVPGTFSTPRTGAFRVLCSFAGVHTPCQH